MFKFVIVLALFVSYANAIGVIPLELGDRSIEPPTSRRIPSTSTFYRLPTDTNPIRYDVFISTDIHKGKEDGLAFNGIVDIYIQSLTTPNSIVLHRHPDLTISQQSLLEAVFVVETKQWTTSTPIALAANTYNDTTNFLTIPLQGTTRLVKDKFYKLTLTFNGKLRGRKAGDSDAGFYASSYTINGVERWLATTQFESTDARHGFPCYDEPALKATFNIKIQHGKDYKAISNTPVKSATGIADYTTTTFEETPKMSTYLIAYVISDFDFVANLREPVTDATKVLHKVYGRPDRKNQLNFTLEAGVEILERLDTYLNVKYIDTLKKMDQIGIPDFAAGAMENWGLVTYTESAFYYMLGTSSHTQKDRITKIVAHEFAHQWFGNLVSPEWWNYIWLNEGFATVFEFLIPNLAYPEYRALDQFTVNVCHRSLITQSATDSRPMTFAAYSPSEISALFDSVAYDKSGCVITMIMHALQETAFKKGLTRYLTDRNLQEANSDQLFAALQTEARALNTIPATLTVKEAFDKWTTQKGYPILTVTFNTANNEITLKQEAFLIDSLTDEDKLTWTIPYNFITDEELSTTVNEDTKPFGWLTTENVTITPTLARNWTNANWVLFNKKSAGYYRVNYDISNWNAIIGYMANRANTEKIHYLNRALLMGDAMNIARAGRLNYDIPFRLAQNLMVNETDYFLWTPFISDFNYLEQITFEATSVYAKLMKLATDVGNHAYNFYTATEKSSDKHYDVMIRSSLINFMCRANHTKCLEDTNKALISYLDKTLAVSDYLKSAILQNGLRNADAGLFVRVWKLIMETTPTHADRSTFISGLGLSNSDDNIKTLLESVLTATGTKYNDVTINYSATERNTILTTVASSKFSGFKRVLDLLKTEVTTVKQIFGNNIATVFGTLAGRTSTTATLTQLKELMTLYQANDVTNRFAGYISTAEANIEWHKGPGSTLYKNEDEDEDDNSASSMIVSAFLVSMTFIFTRIMA